VRAGRPGLTQVGRGSYFVMDELRETAQAVLGRGSSRTARGQAIASDARDDAIALDERRIWLRNMWDDVGKPCSGNTLAVC
jgi:hypothetical protein